MKKYFLFSLAILFFLFIKVEPVSAVTCYTNPLDSSTAFDVIRTCTSNSDCTGDEYCATFGGCGGWSMAWVFSPCKPLDCAGCSVAVNNQCVPQVKPPSTPNCCERSCIESVSGYSASLFDQKCYDLTNIDNDVNNCGFCGKKCTVNQICELGVCKDKTCTPCIDSTLCKDPPICSSATPGNRCVKNPITNMGELQADPTCVGCAATLNLNQQGTTNPCTLKPSVGSGCAEGTDFEIRLGSTAACSGKISAGAGSCSQWTIVSSTTYDLWLNDNGWKKKDTKTADCWGGGGGGGCNNNGVQDNGETGVDCGGGGCGACEKS